MEGLGRMLLLAVALSSALTAFSATERSACLYPLNARLFALERSDGETLRLMRDEDEPQALVGLGGWRGQVDGNEAMVLRLNPDGDPSEGYMFRSGRLVRRMKNGRDMRTLPGAVPRRVGSYAELWPKGLTDDEIREKSIWHDVGRVKFGFVNPNYAAAFLGSVGLLFLPFAVRRRRLGWRIAATVGLLAAGVAVGLTGSRGGMLAFVLSVGLYGAVACRRFLTWKRLAGAAAILVTLVAVAMALHVGDRFTRKMFAVDSSNSERLEIWSASPKMMVDAPWGWGWGQSGIAFTNWYQDRNHFRMVGGMINSHLTILVENGWLVRFGYVALWVWLLVTAFSDACRGGDPLPLAAFAFLAVAATFNSVMFSPASWLVPVVAFAIHAGRLLRGRLWARPWPIVGACALSFVILAGFAVVGLCTENPELTVRGKPGVAIVNGNEPSIWYVEDGQVLDGGYLGCMGKEVRAAYRDGTHPALAFTRRIDKLQAGVEKAVIVGKSCADYLAAWRAGKVGDFPKCLIFLSPSVADDEIPADFRSASGVRVIRGELASQMVEGESGHAMRTVPGAMLYLPNWLDI